MICSGSSVATSMLRARHLAASGLALVLLTLQATGAVAGAPQRPHDDALVLAQVPKQTSPEWQQIRVLHARLAEQPREAKLAAELAGSYVELHRRTADPRLLGLAAGVLEPWRDAASMPAEVALINAHLLQSAHRFTQARQLLTGLLATQPRNEQAWLMLASIALVQADYSAARHACARLVFHPESLVSTGCAAQVARMTGRAGQAYASLSQAIAAGNRAAPATLSWAALTAADTAAQLGRYDDAEQLYGVAISADSSSLAARAAFIDFLLDRDRAAEAAALLHDTPESDSFLLRRARVSVRLGSADRQLRRKLVERYETAARIDPQADLRERALLALEILDDPETALALARNNWAHQRELADARLVLRCALAAGAEDAPDVLAWMRTHEIEDDMLGRLAGQL